MRIAKQTPDLLVVKTNEKRLLYSLGLVALLIGIVGLLLVGIRPLHATPGQRPTLLVWQQDGNPSVEGEGRAGSAATAGYWLAQYTGRTALSRERLVLALAVLSLLAGGLVVVGPYRGIRVIFDQPRRTVVIKQPRWFFRSRTAQHSFDQITEVSVERDRQAGAGQGKQYGVNLIISHSEGVPLSKNYVYYKTIFPLSRSYRYPYRQARAVADRLQTFLAGD